MDKPFSLADYGINQAGNVEIQDALAEYVRKKFDDAVQHKRNTGIEERLLRNLRANMCEYQPDEKLLLGPYNDVYIGISALKARAAASWLTDIILNNIDKPWTLDPTPVPDLPEEQSERAVDMLLGELPAIQSIDALRDRARELKAVFNKIAFSNAEKATQRMETKIEDQMVEGDWSLEFAKFIDDITAYPCAFMRGPIVVSRTVGAWDGNKYTAKDQSIPTVRTISAFDAYPAPNSLTAQDGDHFCERARYSAGQLYRLIEVEGFNAGNIRQVLDTMPNGYKHDLIGDVERDTLEKKNSEGIVQENNNPGEYETVIFNGQVPGKLLADHGILVKDTQNTYECEVWLVGTYVIRAILNPNPTGARPVYMTSYRKIAGSFWGQSVICVTYDVTRVCNAAARSLVRNMGYSSGPIGEVVAERVSEVSDPTDIKPYRVVLVGPDLSGTGAPAYKFHNVQSIAPDIMNVINQWMKYADDLSGVPSYVLGNPQVAGAGRTLGGLSMLMGNAAKGIKNVQLNIDRDVISGVITGFYVYNMITSDDDSIKADCKVQARGATGLLQKELAQTRTVELLQLLTPYIEQWDNLPNGIKIMLREVLKSTGLPVDDIIPNPQEGEEGRDILNLLNAQGVNPGGQAEALNTGMSTSVPLPPQSLPPPGPLSGMPMPVNMPQGA